MTESQIIYVHLVETILNTLTCSDITSVILSYMNSPIPNICTLLSYKLIQLENVKKPSLLIQKAKQLDNCTSLLKSFDSLWDLFSTFLIKNENKEIIEYWYTKIYSIKFNI